MKEGSNDADEDISTVIANEVRSIRERYRDNQATLAGAEIMYEALRDRIGMVVDMPKLSTIY